MLLSDCPFHWPLRVKHTWSCCCNNSPNIVITGIIASIYHYLNYVIPCSKAECVLLFHPSIGCLEKLPNTDDVKVCNSLWGQLHYCNDDINDSHTVQPFYILGMVMWISVISNSTKLSMNHLIW